MRTGGILAAALLVALPVVAAPGWAGEDRGLSSRSQHVTWHGVIDRPAPSGCGGPNLGCDVHDLVVTAPVGAWITVSVDDPGDHVRVTTAGRLVGNGGLQADLNPHSTRAASTTFQQVTGGRVAYQVAVGNMIANPALPASYTATARLAGRAFDRAGDCGVTPGTEHLQDDDPGYRRTLSVRLVADPKDATDVRRAGRTLTEIYNRIGIATRVSYDFMRIDEDGDNVPYEQVRRHYHGVRPAGVDVVHVMTDLYAGGIADCIGGVAFAEKAFSVGNVHYTVQGTVAVSQVPGGMVAAHEIGHLLGAQHQQYNCAEAVPQQVQRPASDGWTGPCTIMSPTALQASETFSTLERATIRAFVRAYAGRP